MLLRSVYYHPQVSEQHESIHIVVFVSMGGWMMHFIAPMERIDITIIAWVFHFVLTS